MGAVANEYDLWGRAVPMTLHGDAVPLARMSFECLSWGGFLGRRLATKDNKFLSSGLLDRCKASDTKQIFQGISVFQKLCLAGGAGQIALL